MSSYNDVAKLRSRSNLITQGYNKQLTETRAFETKKNAHPFGWTLFATLKIKVVGEFEISAFELLAHAFRVKIAVPEGAQELH